MVGAVSVTSHTLAGRNEFPTTSWTLVVAAGNIRHQDCRDALVRLCENYWYPVYACVRRRGYPKEEAQDMTVYSSRRGCAQGLAVAEVKP
jgi:RNA polymerase sigma-70 factor (ECF subfamily)